MFRNATSRRHSELLTLGVAAEPQGERFALVIKGALAVWNVGIAFIVGTSTPPAFTSLERFAQWMIAARYTIIILHRAVAGQAAKTSAGAKSAKSNYLGAYLSRWGRLAARYLPATTCQLPQKKQLHREASPLLVRHWLPRETV